MELERFARRRTSDGRCNNVGEVVRSALRLLQGVEEQRARFTATLMGGGGSGPRWNGSSLATGSR
jgi:putative addiction module CopG family antidote